VPTRTSAVANVITPNSRTATRCFNAASPERTTPFSRDAGELSIAGDSFEIDVKEAEPS
jgi:hypothetical protein